MPNHTADLRARLVDGEEHVRRQRPEEPLEGEPTGLAAQMM